MHAHQKQLIEEEDAHVHTRKHTHTHGVNPLNKRYSLLNEFVSHLLASYGAYFIFVLYNTHTTTSAQQQPAVAAAAATITITTRQVCIDELLCDE